MKIYLLPLGVEEPDLLIVLKKTKINLLSLDMQEPAIVFCHFLVREDPLELTMDNMPFFDKINTFFE